jgi:hypothetical protein
MTADDLVPLLEVEERFALNESSLVLAPDFPLPIGQGWKEFTFFVIVRASGKPDAKFRAVASPIHLYVRDPEVKRKGWRLTIVVHRATKDEVPIGSAVFCEQKVKERIFGEK